MKTQSTEQFIENTRVLNIVPYAEQNKNLWDEFIHQTPMATFLHTRSYLSYHEKRFQDISLLIEDKKKGIVGLLPAAVDPTNNYRIVSHPGITYGGILHTGYLRGEKMIHAFEAIHNYYAIKGFEVLRYKAVPYIYHQVPAADDLYALFRLGAMLYRCDLCCVVDLANRQQRSRRRRRSLKKAIKQGVEVKEGNEFIDALWKVIQENLARKLGTTPVHSLDEILHLHSLFPQNIKFVVGLYDSEVVAGVVLFSSSQVVRTQYIAASNVGYEVCALDAVLEYCLTEVKAQNCRYFDFGASNQNEGLSLKDSLYQFKLEFGGGGVVHNFYEFILQK